MYSKHSGSEATKEHTTLYLPVPISSSDIPIPIIVIDANGIPIVNDDFTLICTGTLEETDLIFTINLSWKYDDSDILAENVTVSTNINESLLLTFDPVRTSHEGEYTCLATLNIDGVQEETEGNSTYDFSAFGIHLYYYNNIHTYNLHALAAV